MYTCSLTFMHTCTCMYMYLIVSIQQERGRTVEIQPTIFITFQSQPGNGTHNHMSYNCELISNFNHVFVESSQIVLEHYRPFVANLKSLYKCMCTNFECSMVVMMSIRRGSISYPASLFTLTGLWEQKNNKTINTYYMYNRHVHQLHDQSHTQKKNYAIRITQKPLCYTVHKVLRL